MESGGTLPVGKELAAILADWVPKTGCQWLFPGKNAAVPGPAAVREFPRSSRSRLSEIGLAFRTSARNLVGRGSGTNAKLINLGDGERKGFYRHTTEEMGDKYDDEKVESLRTGCGQD